MEKDQRKKAKLGDDQEMNVEGKGTMAIQTCQGNTKLLHNVQAHNLLSVGQLMATGYSLMFDGDECIIKEKQLGQVVANI